MNLSWWNGSTTFPNTTATAGYTASSTTTQVPTQAQPQTLDRFVQQVVAVPQQTIITSRPQTVNQTQQPRVYPTQIIKVEGNTDDARPTTTTLPTAGIPSQWSIPGNTISVSLTPNPAAARTPATITTQPQQIIQHQPPQQGTTVLATPQNGTPMLPAFKCAMCEFWTNTEFLLRRHLETVHGATMVKVERDDSAPVVQQGQSQHPAKEKAPRTACLQEMHNVLAVKLPTTNA